MRLTPAFGQDRGDGLHTRHSLCVCGDQWCVEGHEGSSLHRWSSQYLVSRPEVLDHSIICTARTLVFGGSVCVIDSIREGKG